MDHPSHNAARRRRRPSNRKRWYDRLDCGCDCLDLGCNFLVLRGLLNRLALTAPNHPPRPALSAPSRFGLLLIKGYRRWLTHLLPTACRQTPTCSAYGLEAVRRYGLLTGTRLTAGRLSRCNRTTPRGTVDPVP